MADESRICTATRADGSPCRAWAMRGTDPPRCAAHGGTDARIGAPPGNTNALKHAFYALPATRRRVAQKAAAELEALASRQTPALLELTAEEERPAPSGPATSGPAPSGPAPSGPDACGLAASALDAHVPSGIDGHVPSGVQGWSIRSALIDLSIKQELLSRYINAHLEELTVEQFGGLLRIHGQNASRIGRLLRDQRFLTGEENDDLTQAINEALDELGAALGVDL